MTLLTQPDTEQSSPVSTRGGRIRSILRKPASNLALRISDLDRYRLNMWEVSWAAPKESRKEHRENKESASKSASQTGRSLFGRGSSSSSNEVPIFSNLYKRRNLETTSPTASNSTSSSKACATTASNYELDSDRLSVFSAVSEQTTVHISHLVDLNNRRNGQLIDTTRPSPDSYDRNDPHDDPPSPTLTTSSTPWDTDTLENVLLRPWPLIQTLSDDSFVARSTEACSIPRTSCDIPYLINCGVTIVATSSVKSKSRGRSSSNKSQPPPQPPRPHSSRSYTPMHKTPRRMASYNNSLRAEAIDGWKPPNEWHCTPTEPSFQFPDNVESPEPDIPKELNEMQLGVKRLAREDNKVRLLRLTESHDVNGSPSSSQDLEIEKMQWMLSALYNMDGPNYPDISDENTECEPSDPPKKVLALYETPAVTSYLAAVNHSKQVYHLSAAPLSPIAFPNIHPVLSPVRSPSAFPVAPSTIESVHSLRLPLVMASQEIPALLKNIHRCLEPGGSLYLTIIDPLPLTSTLGPLLRSWIEDHLLFNLEASFRCTNPSKVLPLWLKSASLLVDPNLVETRQFYAIPLDDSQLQYVRDGHESEDGLRQELRNTVGRMLWMEIWREYIIADSWWWDDPDILHECTQLQTTWEWRLIEAVKDS
ncbi:hypothetical protein FVEN_g3113 [Fusarium venenatum]|uniref:Uncharacterized protein n=1 Tax=Fusarium venenatum TaxID=56646 RepID=A0A2L2TND2_9HYPO|nr:uncharacterized protein FVRRES_06516 [Fusarium venenatum]KAG8359382.1 hypothetical protein FVEN_g3113 [Fusarium venenatum]KAH6993504.1 hypothetical protein EDB82DRAFT_555750 [Fusarium venenatum]CEI62080.1 unnamed protein product [Fusarium venenatum]